MNSVRTLLNLPSASLKDSLYWSIQNLTSMMDLYSTCALSSTLITVSEKLSLILLNSSYKVYLVVKINRSRRY